MEGVIGAAGALVAAGGFAAYAVRGRTATLFAPSVYRGDRSRPTLALTFDDGPSESTPALLDLLARHEVRATFFMCGQNVRRLPVVARQVAEAGHEIGNHTESHPRLDFKPADFIEKQIHLAQQAIQLHTGIVPRFFRAPYGIRWFGLRRAQERLAVMGVMWTVIGRDWILPAEGISNRLIRGASNGGVLCLHDGRALRKAPDVSAMLGAVDQAIPLLKARGFQFLTLSEMFASVSSPGRAAERR